MTCDKEVPLKNSATGRGWVKLLCRLLEHTWGQMAVVARRHLNPQAWVLICLLFFPRFNLAVKSGVPALRFRHPLDGDRLGSNGGLGLCYRNEEFPEGKLLKERA